MVSSGGRGCDMDRRPVRSTGRSPGGGRSRAGERVLDSERNLRGLSAGREITKTLRAPVPWDSVFTGKRSHVLWIHFRWPALKALGVAEFRRHMDGQCELADAVAIAQQVTRNFAKRQGTWFRNQLTADLEIEGFGDQADGDVCREIAATFPDMTLMPKLKRKD